MKKTIALLLTMVLMMCSLGTVVFAASAPVITDAYIGGFPVVDSYLHAVVDGTYDGVAFENAKKSTSEYAVTATYEWEYGEGDTWTKATPRENVNRILKVTGDMVGKYVRCTITPTDGTTQGQPYVAVFPTKIRTAANAGWQETVIDYVTFDSDVVAAKFIKGGAAPADMTLTWDENKKAMKMAGWTLAEDGTFKLSGKYAWSYLNLPVHHETELFITFDHYVTAGYSGSGYF